MQRYSRARWPTALLVLVAVVVGMPGGPTRAQVTPSTAPGGDPLAGSLLQATDVPPGFATLGPEEGSLLEIDSSAFSRFGGLRIVSQIWSSTINGVVYDFRMLFPTAEAAADYLAAAEPTLSEQDASGLSRALDEPTVIGENARHYVGTIPAGEGPDVLIDNHLFTVGPVAAKVLTATLDLPEGTGRRLAETAARRMAVLPPVPAAVESPGASPHGP